MAVLAGKPSAGFVDRGATVCSCYGVGVNEIAAAIAGGCRGVKTVGEALKAGTNCDSCRGEIARLIEQRDDRVSNIDGKRAEICKLGDQEVDGSSPSPLTI